jgi:hypothetical protein
MALVIFKDKSVQSDSGKKLILFSGIKTRVQLLSMRVFQLLTVFNDSGKQLMLHLGVEPRVQPLSMRRIQPPTILYDNGQHCSCIHVLNYVCNCL